MKRFVVILLALAFLGGVSAQDANGGVLETVLNIDTWVQELTTYADTYEAAFEKTAYALVALGFVASVVGVLMRGSLGAMNSAFVRLFMAAAVIGLSPSLTTLSIDTWKGLRNWSGGEMQATFQDGAAEMEQLGNDAAILAVFATGTASSLLRVQGMGAAQAAGKMRAGRAVDLLNATVIPVAMIGLIANFIILGAGVAIFIACAFLPISAGMLAFSPAQGGEWMGRVVGAVVASLVVTAFMPLIFKAAFDITVVQPVQAVNEEFKELEDYYNPDMLSPPPRLAKIESERQRLLTENGKLQEGLKKWDIFANAGPSTKISANNIKLSALAVESTAVQGTWMATALGSLNNAYDAIANQVTRWGVRLLIMLVGAFMATGLTWWGARTATGLIGGVVGGKIGALAAGGMAGLAGAGGGSRGGGGTNPAGGKSSYSVSDAKPQFSGSGAPSSGGGRSYSPPEGANATTSSAAGATTATVQNRSGGSSSTGSGESGATSSTSSPGFGSVSRT